MVRRPRARRGLTEFRSAYYQDEGWAPQETGRKVAVFSIQGWTDDLFEAVESFRMFKDLKRRDARYVELPYAFAGTAGTVVARVWDVAPGGSTLLMTRGAYRLDAPAYDAPAGTIRLPLYGNHWPLPPGHRIRPDLQEADTPTFRANNLANAFTFTNPRLVLPTRQAAETRLEGVGG